MNLIQKTYVLYSTATIALLLQNANAQPVIVNPSFEGNGGAFSIASGWSSFGSGKWEGVYTGDRGWVQGLADAPAAGSLGIWQQITGAVTGTNYRVTVFARTTRTDLAASIGLDPAGGTSSSNVTWGSSTTGEAWAAVSVEAVAQESTITVFLRSLNVYAGAANLGWTMFDQVAIQIIATPTPTLTATQTRTPTSTNTPGGPTHTLTHTPEENPTPFQPSGPVWGMTLVLGESIVAPGWEHDDKGPPLEKVVQVYGDSAATCIMLGFADWTRMEPSDPGSGPSTYDWSLIGASVDPFLNILPGRLAITYAAFNVPSWLQGQYGTPRYWTLAERFMEAFAREMNRRGCYHFIFENEPNLLARGDWPQYYMERLQHAYAAIKRADARNQVIGGNLAERAAVAGHFNILYDHGLKNYCDVIGTHPYTNDPMTGVDLNDIIVLRGQMVARGDGGKKIWVGEGWGPKRVVPGIDRGNAADRPNRAEIDRLRDFMLNGYSRLATPRADYDPNWLLGASFFTFNDNLGSLHWADRATPVPGGCLIDGYFMEGCDTTPRHHNGGIVDFYGNAKRDLIWRFPNGAFRPSPTPVPNPPALGPNLLVNGDFEGGFAGGVAAGWSRFDTTLTGQWEVRTGRTGGSAQAYGEDDRGFNGGIVQSFETIPGEWYGISAWLAYETGGSGPWTFMAVGWDPTGQTSSPRAFSMVWSQSYQDLGWSAGQWHWIEHLFQATSERASVWFWGGTEWAPPRHFMLVDDVEVRLVQNPVATPTPTDTPAPDLDGDAVPDDLESTAPGAGQTHRWLPDSDGDGLVDGTEDANRNGARDAGETDARAADTDGDAFEDGLEVLLMGSNPLSAGSPGPLPDTDGDGLPLGFDLLPDDPDADDDGFADGYEAALLGLAAAYDARLVPPLGDTNRDGAISNLDALVAQSLFLRTVDPAAVSAGDSDANRDGQISNVDALVLQSVFLGTIVLLPL